MLPQKTTILIAVITMATLLSLGSLSSLIPLDIYASHSYEAGVQGDNIPDNTHIDLSQLILPSTGAFPLYDSSPNFVSGHFLYRAPCDDTTEPPKPLVTVIAGHIDEAANLTHVDKIPLYYVGHASTAGSCVYHAHIPDPLEGGSPRVTDIDLVNYSPNPVAFNSGDAVDINIQRSLGNIGNFYAGNVLLPLDLSGSNPVINLNEDQHEEDAAEASNINTQQAFDNLVPFNEEDVKLLHESLAENNKVFNFNEQHDNNNNEDDNDEEEDQEEDEDQDHNDE